jgi:uncharacterized membrane protein
VTSLYLRLKWAHIVSSAVLFGTGAGIAFFFVRAQRSANPRIIAAAAYAAANELPLPPAYRDYYRRWLLLGWPAFMGVLVIFYLMIAKPRLWG